MPRAKANWYSPPSWRSTAKVGAGSRVAGTARAQSGPSPTSSGLAGAA
jgi:hypothetical protein